MDSNYNYNQGGYGNYDMNVGTEISEQTNESQAINMMSFNQSFGTDAYGGGETNLYQNTNILDQSQNFNRPSNNWAYSTGGDQTQNLNSMDLNKSNNLNQDQIMMGENKDKYQNDDNMNYNLNLTNSSNLNKSTTDAAFNISNLQQGYNSINLQYSNFNMESMNNFQNLPNEDFNNSYIQNREGENKVNDMNQQSFTDNNSMQRNYMTNYQVGANNANMPVNMSNISNPQLNPNYYNKPTINNTRFQGYPGLASPNKAKFNLNANEGPYRNSKLSNILLPNSKDSISNPNLGNQNMIYDSQHQVNLQASNLMVNSPNNPNFNLKQDLYNNDQANKNIIYQQNLSQQNNMGGSNLLNRHYSNMIGLREGIDTSYNSNGHNLQNKSRTNSLTNSNVSTPKPNIYYNNNYKAPMPSALSAGLNKPNLPQQPIKAPESANTVPTSTIAGLPTKADGSYDSELIKSQCLADRQQFFMYLRIIIGNEADKFNYVNDEVIDLYILWKTVVANNGIKAIGRNRGWGKVHEALQLKQDKNKLYSKLKPIYMKNLYRLEEIAFPDFNSASMGGHSSTSTPVPNTHPGTNMLNNTKPMNMQSNLPSLQNQMRNNMLQSNNMPNPNMIQQNKDLYSMSMMKGVNQSDYNMNLNNNNKSNLSQILINNFQSPKVKNETFANSSIQNAPNMGNKPNFINLLNPKTPGINPPSQTAMYSNYPNVDNMNQRNGSTGNIALQNPLSKRDDSQISNDQQINSNERRVPYDYVPFLRQVETYGGISLNIFNYSSGNDSRFGISPGENIRIHRITMALQSKQEVEIHNSLNILVYLSQSVELSLIHCQRLLDTLFFLLKEDYDSLLSSYSGKDIKKTSYKLLLKEASNTLLDLNVGLKEDIKVKVDRSLAIMLILRNLSFTTNNQNYLANSNEVLKLLLSFIKLSEIKLEFNLEIRKHCITLLSNIMEYHKLEENASDSILDLVLELILEFLDCNAHTFLYPSLALECFVKLSTWDQHRIILNQSEYSIYIINLFKSISNSFRNIILEHTTGSGELSLDSLLEEEKLTFLQYLLMALNNILVLMQPINSELKMDGECKDIMFNILRLIKAFITIHHNYRQYKEDKFLDVVNKMCLRALNSIHLFMSKASIHNLSWGLNVHHQLLDLLLLPDLNKDVMLGILNVLK